MPQRGVKEIKPVIFSLYVSLYYLLFFIELSFVPCHTFLPPFYLHILTGFRSLCREHVDIYLYTVYLNLKFKKKTSFLLFLKWALVCIFHSFDGVLFRQVQRKRRTFVSNTRMCLNKWQHCENLRFSLVTVTWVQSLELRYKRIMNVCCCLYLVNMSYWSHHIHRRLREWRIRNFFQNFLFNFTAVFHIRGYFCGS
jgi:hypothetical protein